MAFDYKSGDLFLPGPNHRFNACVGRNGGPYDYHDYAKGYFRSADLTMESVKDGDYLLDILIYPTFYQYRHAFELSLKGLIVDFQMLGDAVSFPKSHQLCAIWSQLVPMLLKYAAEIDAPAAVIDSIGALVADMDALDHSAEVFRFPEDKKGTLFLQDRSRINYARLLPMSHAAEVFESWHYRAKDLRYELKE